MTVAAPEHPLQCRCGTVKGFVRRPKRLTRCICYCKDCQAFARFLGRGDEIMDAQGGTDAIQIAPADVTFTQGKEALACLRLTEKGLLRWYAACCKTPIGNTPANSRLSVIGLVHSCLHEGTSPHGASSPEGGSRGGAASLDAFFGPVDVRVNTKSASGRVKSQPIALAWVIVRFAAMLARARMGGHKPTSFFSAAGEPLVTPKVLSRSELNRLQSFSP